MVGHEPNEMWLEFPFSEDYLEAIYGGRAAGKPVAPEVTDQVTDQVKQVLFILEHGALAALEIQTELGLKHRPTFRANYLDPALEGGLVEMTIPDKPTSRLQKYRLTAAGRARLKAMRG